MPNNSGDSLAGTDAAISDQDTESSVVMRALATQQATLSHVFAVLDEVEAAVDAELDSDEVVAPVLSDDRHLSREQLRQILDISLMAGQLLLQNGADTRRVEETVEELGMALGCDWLDILVSPSTLIITASYGAQHRTKVRRTALFGGVNMELLAEVSRLTNQVKNGKLSRAQTRRELERISAAPRNYSRWFIVFMIGSACGAFSQLFGGDPYVFVVTFLAAAAAMAIRQQLRARHFNTLLTVVATAFVAGVLSSIGVVFGLGPNPAIAMAASVLLLVPGVPLINTFADLVHGHMVVGLTRGITGALVSVGIALGLAMAIEVTGLNNLWHDFSPPQSLLADLCWSGLATCGFAILFNVPVRTLPICVLFGALGHVVRTIFMSHGQGDFGSIEVATYFSALTIGLGARYFERRECIPAPIFAIPAVIPMVPGTFAFGTMVTLLQAAGLLDGVATEFANTNELLTETCVNALKTGLICAALAVGLKTPTLLFDRCKRVV